MNEKDYTDNNLMVLQFDYLKAYLSLYSESPTFATARELSAKYENFHLQTWKNMFAEISTQLKEFDTGYTEDDIQNSEDPVNKKLKTDGTSSNLNKIKARIDGNKLVVLAVTPCDLFIKFFFTDLEFLVSKDPFLSSEMNNFVYVQPNSQTKLESSVFEKYDPASGNTQHGNYRAEFALPEHLKSKNLLIEVSLPLNL
jgi:hypothetical protein